MLQKIPRYLNQLRSLHRLSFAMSRAAASAPLRVLDPAQPGTWEFSGFSQHGEDGIIDYLTRRLRQAHGYFIEIGASNGLENNTTWLALARSFSGLMIDGNERDLAWCQYLLRPMNYGLVFQQMFVTRENVQTIRKLARHPDPDVVSLDIDGNDYHIASAMLSSGFCPKIWVVEYNSAFGPSRSVTIPYRADFRNDMAHGANIYCGCSLAAWRSLMSKNGYHFVTVDASGTNAFFLQPNQFDSEFVANLRGVQWRENSSHRREYGTDWEGQFALLKHRELVEVA
jgi:hypothetical protein